MLYEFVTLNREAIIARTQESVRARPWPSVATDELSHGVPLFLTQLSETLRLATTAEPFPDDAIGNAATLHGRELLNLGFSVSQVVHDYGDICQAVTSLAAEQHAPITVEEFQTLNRCLDTAIAEAVAEHGRVATETRATDLERLGQAAHELRDYLNNALISFHMLKRGTVPINGSTGAVLGRSLMAIREIVESALSGVRLEAGQQRRARVSVAGFIDEIAAVGILHAEYRQIHFTVDPVDTTLMIDADPQLLASAVLNLLQNGFKNTAAGGHVALRARCEGTRLLVEIEDECGGIAPSTSDAFKPFGDRRGADRSGLGLGLSIARQATRAHEGDIAVRNIPGKGCVFTIDLPLMPSEPGVSVGATP